jgi:hypothetical protein
MLEAHAAAGGGGVEAFAQQAVRRLSAVLSGQIQGYRAPTRAGGVRVRGQALGRLKGLASGSSKVDSLKQLAALQKKLQKAPRRLAR